MKIPPPNSYKQAVVTKMGASYDIFVETGTYNGDMVWAQRDNFSTIYSVELSDELYGRAQKRFLDIKHIKLYHGHSPDFLKEILVDLEPSLFWLDAHYSGGNTALGDTPCPLLEELDVILDSGVNHALLIDDARCFGTLKGFPSLSQIEDKIGDFKIENDIIWKILQ